MLRSNRHDNHVDRVREQLRVIHRFYTECVKSVREEYELEIVSINLDLNRDDPDLGGADRDNMPASDPAFLDTDPE